mmetsp:Transcript_122126/g.353063  ORF Transcript_122126/g.353063 Transcript_122126/m.353063 type:complete len:380 (-) Transcript_122126:120-1259(-)
MRSIRDRLLPVAASLCFLLLLLGVTIAHDPLRRYPSLVQNFATSHRHHPLLKIPRGGTASATPTEGEIAVNPEEALPEAIAAEKSDNDATVDYAPSPPLNLSKRMESLKERTIPAVLMLAFLGAIAKYLREDGLIYLTLFLQAGMYQEMTKVIGGEFPHLFYKWWWFLTASVAWNAPKMFGWAQTKIAAGTVGMAVTGILSCIIQFNYKKAEVDEFRDFLRQAAVSFMSALLVVLPSSYWIALLEKYGMKWLALSALLVIINDTMAYVFGSTMGKHKILPVISPSKTWEGFIGATLSTVLAAYFLFETKQDGVVLSLMASIVGPFGGFLASMIKRAYLQKDFGKLFPGHGGLVDRLDCQLMLAPLVYFYFVLSNKAGSS